MIAPRTVEPVALPTAAPTAPPAPAPIIAPFSALFMAQPAASCTRTANVSALAEERLMARILAFLVRDFRECSDAAPPVRPWSGCRACTRIETSPPLLPWPPAAAPHPPH